MTTTLETFNEAVRTVPDLCDEEYFLGEVIASNRMDALLQATGIAMLKNELDPAMGTLVTGIHIGYRIHQLESAPIPPEKVN